MIIPGVKSQKSKNGNGTLNSELWHNSFYKRFIKKENG